MGETTAISYADHTFNPWLGCEKVSAGCAHCFAEAWAKRAGRDHLWHGSRARTSAAYWRKLRAWDRAAREAGERRRVMVTLCDPFEDHPAIYPGWRDDCFREIEACDALDFLLTTKRIENAARMVPESWRGGWPANAWPFATIENASALQSRIEHLLMLPSVVRAVSAEPMLGRLDFLPWDALRACRHGHIAPEDDVPTCQTCGDANDRPAISWMVIGGESGPHARPLDLGALRALVNDCRVANIPTYVKQDSGPRPGQWGRIPEDLRVRELPEVDR